LSFRLHVLSHNDRMKTFFKVDGMKIIKSP
jgi:hypothetical protein